MLNEEAHAHNIENVLMHSGITKYVAYQTDKVVEQLVIGESESKYCA